MKKLSGPLIWEPRKKVSITPTNNVSQTANTVFENIIEAVICKVGAISIRA